MILHRTKVHDVHSSEKSAQDSAEDEAERKLAIEFTVMVTNAFYGMTREERLSCFRGIALMVKAMDSLPPELEPMAIYAPDSERLLVTFNGAPEREPLVVWEF